MSAGQSQLDESALQQGVCDGDRAAFEAMVERHKGAVYGYLRARVLQVDDAEDLTQEVFLRCYVNRQQYDPSCALRPWLMGIARNLLREYSRKHRRRKEVNWIELCLEVDESTQPEEGPFDEAMKHLPGCIEGLGGSAREAISLRYAARMRLAEIGRRLRRSEGAVKLLMFRARQAIKSCLRGKCEVPVDD